MCGKDSSLADWKALAMGSPPHVRERLVNLYVADGQAGITPACAGKTINSLKHYSRTRDHPRMCGKDWYIRDGVVHVLGSPPHVRERLNYGLL